MSRSIENELARVRQQLAVLPETEEPPPTTLQLLGQNTQERAWQQFFVHFVTADAPHGLNHAVLEHILTALADRDDVEFSFSRFDIDDIHIAQEVTTEEGIPDVIMWVPEGWFICWELKVHASEGRDQTDRYVSVDSFDGINLRKSDVPTEGHNYMFLSPRAASPPAANEFIHISWEWIVDELQAFLAASYDAYPARTTAQLKDFADTVRSELTMTEYQENQREMVELYVDNHDVITEIKAAFDDAWSDFQQKWGTRLAKTIETATLVDDPDVSDQYAVVELEMDSGEQRQWTFRQGSSDWSWLFPREWWRRLDTGQPVSDSSKPNARVGFLHRLEWDRETAIGDRTLVVYVRNAPSGHEDFYNGFANRVAEATSEIESALAGTNLTVTGNKSNIIRGEYDIQVERHDGFFDAYLNALARALDEGAVSNPALIETIDRLYEDTIENEVSL